MKCSRVKITNIYIKVPISVNTLDMFYYFSKMIERGKIVAEKNVQKILFKAIAIEFLNLKNLVNI